MMPSVFKHSMVTLRWLGWAVFAVIMLFSSSLLLLRYWLLPDIERFRPHLAAAISQVAGQRISIERIEANWDGLRPYLQLHGVRVHDRHGTPVLILTELDGTASWRSLLYAELRFREIRIERPVLIIRRDADGVLHIAGGSFNQTQADNGFFDWLLRQRQLIVNDADVYWLDELRAAPALYLKKVSLRMRNKDGQHRFGLHATPPAEVAAPLVIRGDFTGESVNALEQWRGRLFVQLNHVDLTVLQTWLSFPETLVFNHGRSAFRAWLDIDAESITSWTADVDLHATGMQWAKDLPKLDFAHLHGRVGRKKNNLTGQQGEQWFARQLRIATEGRSFIKPLDILWQRQGSHGDAFAEHRLQINDLDLGVVASLASHLPIEHSWQKQLTALSPQGVIEQAQIQWQGDWLKPHSFRVAGSFDKLAMKDFGKASLPAISGLSGRIEVTEQGGTLDLASDKVSMKLPEAFDEPLELDKLLARLDWKTSPAQQLTLLELRHISFANQHVSGAIRGRYQGAADRAGTLDLKGELANAEVDYLNRYTAFLGEQQVMQDWLGKRIVAGRLAETHFHIHGDLTDALSDQHSKLALKLATKISDATVKLPAGWPALTEMQASLSLQDNQLEMAISQAKMPDIVVKDARVRIADVQAPNPVLQLQGEAAGVTQKIIGLIEKSPLNRQAIDFSNLGNVAGKGKLQVELTMPMNSSQGEVVTELLGRYQFINNQFEWDNGLPSLSEVNGVLAFTQSSLTIEGLSAQALGGPVMIDALTLPNGQINIKAAGRVNFDRLQPANFGRPANTLQLWTQFMQGATDWSAVFDIDGNGVTVKVESALVGAASTLPEPFSKSAAEMIPVSFMKKPIHSGQEALHFRYGEVVSAEIWRARAENGHYYPLRGVINFRTAPAELPVDAATWVHGVISVLEWDRWQALFKRHDQMAALAGQARGGMKALLTEQIKLNLDIGKLDFLGSRFNELILSANKQGQQTDASVAGREIIGDIDWDAGAKRKAVVRLKKLVMPETLPEHEFLAGKRNQPKDWPVIDLYADEFIVGEKVLGDLLLSAHQQQDGWYIDKLQITNPVSVLRMQGVWQNRIAPFQMQAEVKLQANSIGKFLSRLGYPGRIARGEGELEGTLTWLGEPFSIDFPSLSGNLRVTAQRGQFTKFKPGVSKLLGIFDLKSLPRRLTLDFYDVFSQGFGFEDIWGNVRIMQGVAATDELQIAGSAAYLAVSGEIDLVEETQALLVKMFPSLGLVTPVVGIASMIASQSLKDPFDRVLFNEYAITGTWGEPIVVKSQSSQEIKE